jgi:hypothetical protein
LREGAALRLAGCYFERALVVALEQQVKSWELRAATSVARVWRDQSKTCRGNEDRCNQMNKQGGTENRCEAAKAKFE